MIRINLANTGGTKKKKGGGVKKLAGAFLFVMLLMLAGYGTYYYLIVMEHPVKKPLPEPVEVAAPEPAPVPKDDSPEARPSSQVRTNIVENTVKELGSGVDGSAPPEAVVSAAAAAARLDVPYNDMTTGEKINYEVLFGRNVLDMITRCTPPGIGYRQLDIENFQTVYGTGSGVSRQMVQELFASFRVERGELMPRPYSNIKDDDGGRFNFTVMHRPHFGPQVSDPFQALDHIGFRDGLSQLVQRMSQIADENGLKLSAAPAQVSVDRVGSYRRVAYKVTGMSTYKDFHKFVLALYSDRLPCALKKASLRAVRDEQVSVTAEILFTVKE
ncbi:MAG: hypothetical protein FWC23_03575 [Chitinispirillia bacterium]|nr:hypothetical protein [Chitinispirillia bacterium]MCL2268255.1 hypothetical protein [Chitinispirillia bacterium]